MFFAVAGPVLIMAVLGLAIGTVYGFSTGDAGQAIPDYLGTALVKVAAVWVVMGIVVALYGLLPRLSAYGSWATLIASALLELGWELRQISETLFGISPFAHIHPLFAGVTIVTGVELILVAAALASIGFLGFRRRDIA